MNITVIGGGNIGTLLAGELTRGGHRVCVYTPKASRWSHEIEVLESTGGGHSYSVVLSMVTDDLKLALKDAELIWVTVPAMAFQKTAQDMLPYVRAGQMICVEPGSGGAEFVFRPLIDKGCIFCGLQRTHSVARLREYGKSVLMLGKKPEIQLAAIPATETARMGQLLEQLLEMPCQILPNYLCVTLTPSNPILHTTRLRSMFRDWKEGVYYPRNILFYEEWTDESSELLFACDAEVQNLCNAIPLPLESVKSLRVYYESETPQALTRKIRSIPAFKGLTSPMVQVGEDRWIPDFSSRYFTADFPYGLKILIDLCQLYGIESPNMCSVWEWYTSLVPEALEDCFTVRASAEELLRLYE